MTATAATPAGANRPEFAPFPGLGRYFPNPTGALFNSIGSFFSDVGTGIANTFQKTLNFVSGNGFNTNEQITARAAEQEAMIKQLLAEKVNNVNAGIKTSTSSAEDDDQLEILIKSKDEGKLESSKLEKMIAEIGLDLDLNNIALEAEAPEYELLAAGKGAGGATRKKASGVWKATKSWSDIDKEDFNALVAAEAEKLAQQYAARGEKLDCADLSLTALIITARKLALPLSLRVYDSKARGYKTLSSSSGSRQSFNDFVDKVQKDFHSQSLSDSTASVMREKKFSDIQTGDLIIYNLQDHMQANSTDPNRPAYRGHVMMLLERTIDTKPIIYTVIEGHTVGTPNIADYTQAEIYSQFGKNKPKIFQWNFKTLSNGQIK